MAGVDLTAFVVVVQSDALDALPTVIVAPLVDDAEPADYRPEIVLGDRRPRVCCDRLRSETRSSLGAIVARLDADEQAAVDAAVALVCAPELRTSRVPRRRA